MAKNGLPSEALSSKSQKSDELRGEANEMSPHLRRVRAISQFFTGPGVIVVSVLLIGAIVISAASGG